MEWRFPGVVALLVLLLAGCGGGEAAPPARHAAPQAVLSRAPYLGVACRVPNAFACDRVGLAVWLRRPARAVRARVGGRALRLDDRGWSGRAQRGRRRLFAAFLRPAGLLDGPLRVTADDGPGRYVGRRPVIARVELRVTDDAGATVLTGVRVRLAPGWG